MNNNKIHFLLLLIAAVIFFNFNSCKNQFKNNHSEISTEEKTFFEVSFNTGNDSAGSIKAEYKGGLEIKSGLKVLKGSIIVFKVNQKDYDYELTDWEINNAAVNGSCGKTKIEVTVNKNLFVKVNFKKKIFDTTKPNITFKIADSLSSGRDEADINLTLGAKKENTPIQIDWGAGKEDFIIGSTTPAIIRRAVNAGGEVKIYGKLNHFNAMANKFIIEISFYNCGQLETVRLSQNKIQKIDLRTLPALKEIHVTDNAFTEIDLSGAENLEEFYCGWNKISELDTKKNPKLTVLTCYNTDIKKLDISGNPELEVLTAGDNTYTSPIILENNAKLKSLDLENCKLTALDITKLSKLETLRFKGNNITEIDLTGNIFLTYLDLGKNRLKNLNLSNLTELKELRVNGNALSALDLSKNNKLNVINLKGNKFDACALNKLYTEMNPPAELNTNAFAVGENPGAATSKTSIAKNKGWRMDIEGDGSGCRQG